MHFGSAKELADYQAGRKPYSEDLTEEERKYLIINWSTDDQKVSNLICMYCQEPLGLPAPTQYADSVLKSQNPSPYPDENPSPYPDDERMEDNPPNAEAPEDRNEEQNPGKHVELLHCGHALHTDCARKWFFTPNNTKTNNTCPTCRQTPAEDDLLAIKAVRPSFNLERVAAVRSDDAEPPLDDGEFDHISSPNLYDRRIVEGLRVIMEGYQQLRDPQSRLGLTRSVSLSAMALWSNGLFVRSENYKGARTLLYDGYYKGHGLQGGLYAAERAILVDTLRVNLLPYAATSSQWDLGRAFHLFRNRRRLLAELANVTQPTGDTPVMKLPLGFFEQTMELVINAATPPPPVPSLGITAEVANQLVMTFKHGFATCLLQYFGHTTSAHRFTEHLIWITRTSAANWDVYLQSFGTRQQLVSQIEETERNDVRANHIDNVESWTEVVYPQVVQELPYHTNFSEVLDAIMHRQQELFEMGREEYPDEDDQALYNERRVSQPLEDNVYNVTNDQLDRLLKATHTTFQYVLDDIVFGLLVLAMRLRCNFQSRYAEYAFELYKSQAMGHASPNETDYHLQTGYASSFDSSGSGGRQFNPTFASRWRDPETGQIVTDEDGAQHTLYYWVSKFKRAAEARRVERVRQQRLQRAPRLVVDSRRDRSPEQRMDDRRIRRRTNALLLGRDGDDADGTSQPARRPGGRFAHMALM